MRWKPGTARTWSTAAGWTPRTGGTGPSAPGCASCPARPAAPRISGRPEERAGTRPISTRWTRRAATTRPRSARRPGSGSRRTRRRTCRPARGAADVPALRIALPESTAGDAELIAEAIRDAGVLEFTEMPGGEPVSVLVGDVTAEP